ncbi:ATP phosphoribosyltransferase regulatory subunit [Lentibacillus sp. Marseille-P4043]|uniref:ATP phosphoribosyltransferase regulatory subunit n=1 Tax=Lentibacillus sp. Marseille-P4043 TaxID=2040293 RepID=UPI000D0B2176|nr:ATP phosphoribosyltransferase regulatory subunit [Lentibacillus sp. Marseille-P4043]
MVIDVLNKMNTLRLNEFEKKEQLLAKIKARFSTYGYRHVQTSAFEQYDLYQTTTGTIDTDEMIKVIDPNGKVLVLRPDVTIPITRMVATGNQLNPSEERLYYISTVFRNLAMQPNKREHTQAGIENFEPKSAALDAEVIALAIHTLQDLGFTDFKLEIGHAGFFKELLSEIHISKQETDQLKAIIQAKDFSGMKDFLKKLSIDTKDKYALKQIPLLYGNPEDVIERAKSVSLNSQMDRKLQDLTKIIDVLKLYEVERFISLDLGLINHMNYYSDIIFQGFVENFGKPVLMGGRYDHLAEQFSKVMPAIGFACDVDSIFSVLEQQSLISGEESHIDVLIYYTTSKQKEALSTASTLRNQGFRVLISPIDSVRDFPSSSSIVYYEENQNLVNNQHSMQSFSTTKKLLELLGGGL